MARYGYILYPNGNSSSAFTDTNYTWKTNKVAFTISASKSLTEIISYYVADTMSDNGVPNFSFPDTPSTGTSSWIMYKHDAGEGNNTSLSTLSSIATAIEDYVDTTSYSDWSAIINNTGTYPSLIPSTSNVTVSSSSTFNTSNDSSDIASYNWSTVDTSGYSYPSEFASSMSGNEDYPTDYWSKTDFQTATVGAKSQVISKIATNSNDILEFIVKKSLTQNQIRQLYVQLVKDGIIT